MIFLPLKDCNRAQEIIYQCTLYDVNDFSIEWNISLRFAGMMVVFVIIL